MVIYFVRHGETDWNVEKKIQGSADIPLNENGKQQAKNLAMQLTKQRDMGSFHAVRAYTSPQMRAAETAQTVADALGIPCISIDGLKEMSMGQWEGLDWNTVETEYGSVYEHWNSNRRYVKPPEGESYNDLLARTLAVLSDILEREEENVLVVSHSAVLMAIRCYVAGAPFEEESMVVRYKTKNTEVVALTREEIWRALQQFKREEMGMGL